MSIHIDLLIPSFSVPFASTGTRLDAFSEQELHNLLDQCAKAFGVDGSEIELFKMVNNKMDMRIGCFITGSRMSVHATPQQKIVIL